MRATEAESTLVVACDSGVCEGFLGPYQNGPHVLTRRTPPWERDPYLFCALQEDPPLGEGPWLEQGSGPTRLEP